MDDTPVCPICGVKFRNIHLSNKLIPYIGKQSNFTERTCNGMNHVIQIYADIKTQKVDLIKLSLNHKYSRYLEIDFLNQKCRISCMKDSKAEYIEIPKMIIPDFPGLEKLKTRISLYVMLS